MRSKAMRQSKKKYFIFLSIAYFIFVLSISTSVNASEQLLTEVEHLENGDYIEILLEYDSTPAITLSSSSKTISGSKTVRYKSGNTTLWTLKVKGSFSYNGSSSKCTSSSVSTTSPGKTWYISKSSASKSKNSATAKTTAQRKVSGIVLQTVTRSVTLTCSKSGKLS